MVLHSTVKLSDFFGELVRFFSTAFFPTGVPNSFLASSRTYSYLFDV